MDLGKAIEKRDADDMLESSKNVGNLMNKNVADPGVIFNGKKVRIEHEDVDNGVSNGLVFALGKEQSQGVKNSGPLEIIDR